MRERVSMTNHASSLPVIERAGYIAICSPDPAAAAQFAVAHMGLSLVHVDGDGRHYLAGDGLDPYDLVYTVGERKTIDHIAYLVRDLATLNELQARWTAAGIDFERLDHHLWRGGAALRVKAPAGHFVHVTTGVYTQTPQGFTVIPHEPPPAPITFDHAAPRITDTVAEVEFLTTVLGLKESARVVEPEGAIAIAFFRAHTLFHCYTVVAGPFNGLHHYQFTLKNAFAVQEAAEKMKADGVEIVWGPVRHGPGHNVAFYFYDNDGNIVEYSAEEEIILDAAGYIAQEWSVLNPKFADEWGSTPPEIFFA
jgi:catechol 2,3-dioxygenase